MYTEHFGLKILPFENVPDPQFFFDQGDHARVHKRIKESLKANRGLMVVTGPIGSGKTTLSQMLISEFSKDIRLIWMAEPPTGSTELFLFIAQELGQQPESPERTFVLRDIRLALQKIKSEDSKCLLIIDESHLISDDVINGIRLLNNLEEGSAKLIQILLLGQEELIQIISRPEMEAFKQRISALEIIGKMNADRIREYISHRIHIAGGSRSLFSDKGWEALTLAFDTGGTPRLINSLCDRSLSIAYEREKAIVDPHDVYEASKGIGVGKEIFHYIVALKAKERATEDPSNGDSPSLKDAETSVQDHEPLFIQKSHETGTKHEHTRSDPSYIGTEDSGVPAVHQKRLKKPVLFFLLSSVVLISALLYYCNRSDSPDVITCLTALLGF